MNDTVGWQIPRKALFLVLVAVCLVFFSSFLKAETIGDDEANRLQGTSEFDVFYGGDGADTFVVDSLSERPDWVLDFDPEEGDLVELVTDRLGLTSVTQSQFSLNQKGVLALKLDGENVPLINLGRSDVKFELDSRKGRYLLKFDKKL